MAYRCNEADWSMEFASEGCLELTSYPPGDLGQQAKVLWSDSPGRPRSKSMRERAARLGRTLEVESAPGDGTRVRARIPA